MNFYKIVLSIAGFALVSCTSHTNKESKESQILVISDSTYQKIDYYSDGVIKSKSVWLRGKQGLVYEKYSKDGKLIKDERRVLLHGEDTVPVNSKAKVIVLLSDSSKNVSMSICRYDSNFVLSEEIFMPVKNGVGLIEFTPTIRGINEVTGIVRIKEDTAFTYAYPFAYQCFVK